MNKYFTKSEYVEFLSHFRTDNRIMQATLAKSPQNFRRRISSSARSLYPCDIKGKSASATPISTYEQNGAIDQFGGILPPSLNEYNESKICLYM